MPSPKGVSVNGRQLVNAHDSQFFTYDDALVTSGSDLNYERLFALTF
jgi:hypothetical protein